MRKLPTYITLEEFKKIIEVTHKKHHKVAYLLGFASGLRISEVLNLKPEHIDITRKTIFIKEGKGKKDRVAPLPKGFKDDYLTLLPLKMGCRALSVSFKRACKRAGMLQTKPNLHFHSLRHSFATRYLEQGGRIEELKMLMGHSSISTTDIYSHINPKKALDEYQELF